MVRLSFSFFAWEIGIIVSSGKWVIYMVSLPNNITSLFHSKKEIIKSQRRGNVEKETINNRVNYRYYDNVLIMPCHASRMLQYTTLRLHYPAGIAYLLPVNI